MEESVAAAKEETSSREEAQLARQKELKSELVSVRFELAESMKQRLRFAELVVKSNAHVGALERRAAALQRGRQADQQQVRQLQLEASAARAKRQGDAALAAAAVSASDAVDEELMSAAEVAAALTTYHAKADALVAAARVDMELAAAAALAEEAEAAVKQRVLAELAAVAPRMDAAKAAAAASIAAAEAALEALVVVARDAQEQAHEAVLDLQVGAPRWPHNTLVVVVVRRWFVVRGLVGNRRLFFWRFDCWAAGC
jgi:hypothetical protein